VRVWGYTHKGATPVALAVDTVRTSRFTITSRSLVSKVSVYLDAAGSPGGQNARAVIYRASDGALMAVSQELVVPGGAAAAWVDFRFAADYVALDPADYDIGLHGGVTGGAIRLFADTGGTGRSNADTYADGTATTRPATSSDTNLYSAFLTYTTEWTAPDVADEELARLPFSQAQEYFADVAAPVPPSAPRYRSVAGWHGTIVDPERGAFALVHPDGALAELVGDRVRVRATPSGRQVIVYVSALNDDIIEDISLTRRAFADIALLSQDNQNVIVEVLV
jgi:hypothetical protein